MTKRGARPRRETSAGGLVFRRDGDRTTVLLIRDAHQSWGFPKGHVEPGEDPAHAAAREVREETGLGELVLVGPLDTIEWTFRARGGRVQKTCHFFAFATDEVRTRPLRSEGITACRWVSIPEAERMLTWDNARAVLRGAQARLDALAPAAGA